MFIYRWIGGEINMLTDDMIGWFMSHTCFHSLHVSLLVSQQVISQHRCR